IEAFLALADERHFGRAAKRLSVSASRVSQLIQALERRVGGQLAVRDGHGVRLTGLGERLLADARPGYARLARAMATDVVRLGTWTWITGTVSSELCARYERAYPGRRAEWGTVPYPVMYLPLQQRQVDVLMLLLPGPPGACPAPAGISVGPVLGKGERVLLVPEDHPLAARPAITSEDLADCQLILPDERPPDWFVEAWYPAVTPGGREITRIGGMPPIRYSDELFDLISRRGLGVIAPPWALEEHPWPGLTAVPVQGLPPIHAVLAAREQADEPLVDDFLSVAARAQIPLGRGNFPVG
ncbi:MAG: LysR family transcriptional regulator, partial [Actinobacteria bacterium]|nr:LysR family transcriptional regulator [Actinomycetota bacterium]